MVVNSRRRTHHKKRKTNFLCKLWDSLKADNYLYLCSRRSASSTVFFLLQTSTTTVEYSGQHLWRCIISNARKLAKSLSTNLSNHTNPIYSYWHPPIHHSTDPVYFPVPYCTVCMTIEEEKELMNGITWSWQRKFAIVILSRFTHPHAHKTIPRSTHPVIHRPS